MRKTLEALYDGAAVLAALCMIGLLIMVTMSIAGRQLHFNLRGSDAYAGYFMAGAGFLALAHTLKRGEHIRVTLLLSRLQGGAKRALEIWSLGAGFLLALLAAYYSTRLVFQSYSFHDISTANDATPLWIPQIPMAIGSIVLAIALLDDFVMEILGRRVQFEPQDALHNE